MSFLGNLIWFLIVGWWSALGWLLFGLIWCITIIGIPLGKQCFKFARLTLMPFGKEIEYGGGAISFIANIIWIFIPGFEMAVGYLTIGLVLCLTIIGIPFGKQCFKLAKLALMPFGTSVN